MSCPRTQGSDAGEANPQPLGLVSSTIPLSLPRSLGWRFADGQTVPAKHKNGHAIVVDLLCSLQMHVPCIKSIQPAEEIHKCALP